MNCDKCGKEVVFGGTHEKSDYWAIHHGYETYYLCTRCRNEYIIIGKMARILGDLRTPIIRAALKNAQEVILDIVDQILKQDVDIYQIDEGGYYGHGSIFYVISQYRLLRKYEGLLWNSSQK